MRNKNIKNNKGYTLLFAVLVSSVVLSIGISILTISKKEFLLSSSARDSISAFYAADSGFECALYHSDAGFFDTVSGSTLNCMNQTISVSPVYQESPYPVTFSLKMIGSDACSIVTVDKIFNLNSASTTIVSRGYNMGWTNNGGGSCSIASPRRVERAIEYKF